MPHTDASDRANSHRWVVHLTMPVRLALAPDGSVLGVIPGMPNPNDLTSPTCDACGADNFDQLCPMATTTGGAQ